MIRVPMLALLATVLTVVVAAGCTDSPENNATDESTVQDGSAPTMGIGSVEYFDSIRGQLKSEEHLERLPDFLQEGNPDFVLRPNEITTWQQEQAGERVYSGAIQTDEVDYVEIVVTVVVDESGFPTVTDLEVPSLGA